MTSHLPQLRAFVENDPEASIHNVVFFAGTTPEAVALRPAVPAGGLGRLMRAEDSATFPNHEVTQHVRGRAAAMVTASGYGTD